MDLESVELDGLLGDTKFLLDKVGDFAALIALELDHFAEFRVLDNVTVGCEFFLENLQDTFRVIFLGKTLDGGQSFTTITLLDTYVYVGRS